LVSEVTGVSTLTISAGSGSGFFYIARPSTVIEGDRPRGYFMTARYTTSNTDFVEVYAANAEVIDSKLHNT